MINNVKDSRINQQRLERVDHIYKSANKREDVSEKLTIVSVWLDNSIKNTDKLRKNGSGVRHLMSVGCGVNRLMSRALHTPRTYIESGGSRLALSSVGASPIVCIKIWSNPY